MAIRCVRKTLTRRNGDITKFFGMFDSGNPDSSDNEQIDRDLAHAYADDHEDKK